MGVLVLSLVIYRGYYKGNLPDYEQCIWVKEGELQVGVLPPRVEWDYRFFSFWQGHFLGFYKAHEALSRWVPEPVSAALLLVASAGIEAAEMSLFKTSPANLGDLSASALGIAFASLRKRGLGRELRFAWHWAYIRGRNEWNELGFDWADLSRVPDSYGPYAFGIVFGKLELGITYSARRPAYPGPFGAVSGYYIDDFLVGGERFPFYTQGPGFYALVRSTL